MVLSGILVEECLSDWKVKKGKLHCDAPDFILLKSGLLIDSEQLFELSNKHVQGQSVARVE